MNARKSIRFFGKSNKYFHYVRLAWRVFAGHNRSKPACTAVGQWQAHAGALSRFKAHLRAIGRRGTTRRAAIRVERTLLMMRYMRYQ